LPSLLGVCPSGPRRRSRLFTTVLVGCVLLECLHDLRRHGLGQRGRDCVGEFRCDCLRNQESLKQRCSRGSPPCHRSFAHCCHGSFEQCCHGASASARGLG